jgi:hypothetical protein
MAARKSQSQDKPESEKSSEVVLAQFAYATAKDGEVVQLVKGNHVDADRFTAKSLEHLRDLGFIGSQD